MPSIRSVHSTAERRARLTADRQIATRERRMRSESERLERLSRILSARIDDQRAEIARLREEADTLRRDAGATPGEATIWSALQTLKDGFAIYDAEHRLVVANEAYLSAFDGLEEMRPGISYRRVAELLLDEGIVDPAPHGADWVEHLVARWRRAQIPSELIRLWSGQAIKLIERHLPDGGVVALAVNQTEMIRVVAAIDAIPDGFSVFDRDDRLVMCNRAFRAQFPGGGRDIRPGIAFADILRGGLAAGRYADAVGREEDWLDQRLERRAASRGETFEQEIGGGRWFRIVEHPTPDGGSASLRIDITRMKRTEEELRRLHETAEAATRAKGAFLSNMSHEIRTPVNGIVGMAELLLDGEMSQTHRRFAATLRDSATALLTLVDDVLDFSRSESGLLTLEPDPFDPAGLVRDVLGSFAAAAQQKGLDLRLDLAPDLPGRLVGDARRVRQILTNLVANAVKFTPRGHVALSARAASSGPGLARLTVEVSDTGPGIPDRKAQHIFAGFAQVEEDQDRTHDGAGLGLAICRRLTELMEGEIAYRPGAAGGSVFALTLVLPRRAVAGPAPADAPRAPRIPDARPLRILAAEDNGTNRLILQKLLAPLGVELTLASNGIEAVAALVGCRPDLVLMDISMPDMDGREAARRIRAREAETGHDPLPIVAMTAHALAEDIAAIRAAGIDDVLTKPLSRPALSDRIETVRAAGQAAAAAALRKKAGASGSDQSGE